MAKKDKPDPAAVSLGRRGGRATAKRGPDYYRKINAMRKTKAGGRPRKRANGRKGRNPGVLESERPGLG